MPKRRRKTRQWRKKGREVEDEVMEVIRKRGEEEAMRGVENDQLFTSRAVATAVIFSMKMI